MKKKYSWDDLYKRADNAACGEDTLKSKDEARYQVRHFAMELGYEDLEMAECPEDEVEWYCDKYNILFDENGNIINECEQNEATNTVRPREEGIVYMKKYDTVILSKDEQKKLFGKELEFNNGFVSEPRIDWWNILEDYLCQPVVSVRPSGRESWNEIIVMCAKGFIKNSIAYLNYNTLEDFQTVLTDIFNEAENDEYEVFESYNGTCSKKLWKQVEDWVHKIY